MKIFQTFFYLVVSTVLLSQTVNAQIILTKLGNHPFHQPSLNSISDLLNMVKENQNDIKEGFNKNGISEVFDDFIVKLYSVEINKVKLKNGTRFEWMLYRKKGVGPLLIANDIIWINETPIIAFQFHIDSNGRRYNFAVPLICSNISLRGVTGLPVISTKPEKEKIVIKPEAKKAVDVKPTFTSKPTDVVTLKTKVIKRGISPAAEPPTSAILGLNVLADLGYLHQFDPGEYLLVRLGLEKMINDNFSILCLVGTTLHLNGTDGKTAFIVDLIGDYTFSKSFIDIGIGGWITDGYKNNEAENSQIDIIAALGTMIFGEKDNFNVSLFIEARQGINELNDMHTVKSFGRYGGGLRFRF